MADSTPRMYSQDLGSSRYSVTAFEGPCSPVPGLLCDGGGPHDLALLAAQADFHLPRLPRQVADVPGRVQVGDLGAGTGCAGEGKGAGGEGTCLTKPSTRMGRLWGRFWIQARCTASSHNPSTI